MAKKDDQDQTGDETVAEMVDEREGNPCCWRAASGMVFGCCCPADSVDERVIGDLSFHFQELPLLLLLIPFPVHCC